MSEETTQLHRPSGRVGSTRRLPPVSYPLTKRQRVPRLPSELSPDFGQMLHELRGKGMSLEALSRELGCSREALYSLLTGRVEDTKYSIGRGIIHLWKLSTGNSLPLFLREKIDDKKRRIERWTFSDL